jgi:hypothetical protein
MDFSRFGPSTNPLAAALASGGQQPAGNPTTQSSGLSPQMQSMLTGGGQGALPGLPGGPSILPQISPTPGAGAPNLAGGSGNLPAATFSIPGAGGLPGGPAFNPSSPFAGIGAGTGPAFDPSNPFAGVPNTGPQLNPSNPLNLPASAPPGGGTGLPSGVGQFGKYMNGPGGGVVPSSFTSQGVPALPTGDQTALPAGLQGQGLGPMSGPGPMPANFQPAFDAENPMINPTVGSLPPPVPPHALPIVNNPAPSFGFGSNPLGQFNNPKGA